MRYTMPGDVIIPSTVVQGRSSPRSWSSILPSWLPGAQTSGSDTLAGLAMTPSQREIIICLPVSFEMSVANLLLLALN